MIKKVWDLYIAFTGGAAYYGAQMTGILETESFVNIILGLVLIILGVVRIFYLIKNKGITSKK